MTHFSIIHTHFIMLWKHAKFSALAPETFKPRISALEIELIEISQWKFT